MFLEQSTGCGEIKIVSSIRVESSMGEHKLILTNSEFEDELWFYRKDGRWRDASMRLCGIHRIVKCIFEYPDEPMQGHIDLMEGTVRMIATILDQSVETYKEAVRIRQEKNAAFRPRQFFPDDDINIKYIESEARNEEDAKRHGWLYLMRHTNGLTKIGKSVQPKVREKTLQAEDPRLEMILCVEGQGYREKALHRIFDELRVRGEWFRLEDRHVEWISFLFNGLAS